MRYASMAALSAAALLLLLLAACDSGGESGGEDVGVSADASIPSLEDVVDAGSQADVPPKVDLHRPDIGEDTGEDVPAPPPDVAEDTAPDTSSVDVPEPACEAGEPCDDGDPCTQDDVCTDGVCAGAAYTCEDDLSCTADLCDGEGGCSFPLQGGFCLIGDVCYEDGAANPDNVCQACIPPLSTEQWSAGPAESCDDDDACTSGDTCRGGLCVGTAIDCGEPGECRAYHCDSAVGCVEDLLSDTACDDGDACTSGDTCQEGVCTAGSTVTSCDDGNDCTDDACDPTTGDCIHTFNTGPCNDHSVCTQVDVCVEGVCVGQQPLDCADENVCTDDGCHPMQGCIHVNNTDPCEDGDPCSVGDRCVAGSCGAGPGLLDCGGDNPCLDYACVTGMGCVEIPNDNVCSDDNACTVGDRCGEGQCQPGDEPLDCVDGNLCTDDLCDPASGCTWEDNAVACDDEDPCTVGDHCGAGACQPGEEELACPSDGDPCTFNRCSAGVGCVADALTGPACDDEDPCTVGDSCSEGLCVPGADELECVDDNECTANYCESGVGCIVEPLTGTDCSDEDACTVLGSEHCEDGVCVGTALDCDDFNSCTDDSCDPLSGCVNEASGVIECWPQVLVNYPPRGATIVDGSGVVNVTGIVQPYGGGSIDRFEINGETVAFDGDGLFSFPMDAAHGLNMIRVLAEDDLGVQRDVRQSYQYSEAYWPMDIADPEAARIDDGIVLFLSDELVDDHDRSDVDDLATIMEMMFASLDLNDMIPNPAAEVSEAGCDYEIEVRNVSHDPPALNLYLQPNALRLVLTIDDFHARVDASADDWWCPDADVDVDADRITVDAAVQVTMVNGVVQATVISNNVTFQGMSFSDSNWLIDILIGLFEGSIEDELESAFEDAIEDMVPELLQDVFDQFALNETFEIPAFLPGQLPATVALDSTLSTLDIAADGIVLGMGAVVMAESQGTPYTPAGAIARDTCLSGTVPVFVMPREHTIDVGIFDDLLNEILYSVYMAGVLEMTVDDETLGQDLSGYGISAMTLDISAMLPPIIEWCDDEAPMEVQLGDMRIDADLTLLGNAIEVLMYASLAANGSIDLVTADDGSLELGITVGELLFLDVEIAFITPGFENLVPTLQALISEQLVPTLLDGMIGESLGSFPIPEIDLSSFDESIPEGTVIAIGAEAMWRDVGYTLIGGGVDATR